ncbi:osiris 4 isoform X2 [Haematobia irritans]|uniref:osiris 4 isoform X2 n=1 Tax=Haematobia irritans TaxID=7368 RepID=UPI003F4FC2DE
MARFSNDKNSLKAISILLIVHLSCSLIQLCDAEIRNRYSSSHGSKSANVKLNSIHDGHTKNSENKADADMPSSSSSSSDGSSTVPVNTDFVDKMSWKCANNASCLYSLANSIISSYRRGESIHLGFLDLVKLAPSKNPNTNWNATETETGRGISTFMDFISGNAIRIPVGPMVFSVQRDEDDANYIEVALLKKATSSTARLGDEGGGGLLGGGGGGGGHGIIHRFKERHHKEDKKQMQMYIPMYLAATTFGWTLVAAKFVGMLTLKALAISKIAFIVAAMVLMKKLMDNASDKMMYQYPEHSPYMMPYSMDYGMHSMAAAPHDIAASDMYAGGMPLHAAAAVAPLGGHPSHPGMEHYAAESSLHQNIADGQNNTQVLAALNAVGLGQKVKREDTWLGRNTASPRRPLVYNYVNPYAHYRQ